MAMKLPAEACFHQLQPKWLKALCLFVHMRRELTEAPTGTIAEQESDIDFAGGELQGFPCPY
jgi:hypothetical protein